MVSILLELIVCEKKLAEMVMLVGEIIIDGTVLWGS